MAHKIEPGQENPLTKARVINSVLDATDWFKRQQQGGVPTQVPSTTQPENCVKVKNLTGSALQRGSAVQLGSYLVTSALDPRRAWFQGNAVSSLSSNLAITTRPLATNGYGEAAVAGICTARVNFGSTTDQYASFATSSTTLTSGASGPVKILQAPGSTGVHEVWVQFVAPASNNPQLAKLTATGLTNNILLPGAAAAQFTLWTGTPGAESATSTTVNAAARFEPCDKTGFAWLGNDGGGYYVVASEHLALQIYGTLASTLSTGGSSTVAVNVTLAINGTAPSGTINVANPGSVFYGTPGDPFMAVLDRWSGTYYFVWVGC